MSRDLQRRFKEFRRENLQEEINLGLEPLPSVEDLYRQHYDSQNKITAKSRVIGNLNLNLEQNPDPITRTQLTSIKAIKNLQSIPEEELNIKSRSLKSRNENIRLRKYQGIIDSQVNQTIAAVGPDVDLLIEKEKTLPIIKRLASLHFQQQNVKTETTPRITGSTSMRARSDGIGTLTNFKIASGVTTTSINQINSSRDYGTRAELNQSTSQNYYKSPATYNPKKYHAGVFKTEIADDDVLRNFKKISKIYDVSSPRLYFQEGLNVSKDLSKDYSIFNKTENRSDTDFSTTMNRSKIMKQKSNIETGGRSHLLRTQYTMNSRVAPMPKLTTSVDLAELENKFQKTFVYEGMGILSLYQQKQRETVLTKEADLKKFVIHASKIRKKDLEYIEKKTGEKLHFDPENIKQNEKVEFTREDIMIL